MTSPGWQVARHHRGGARRIVVALVAVAVVGLVTAGAVAARGTSSDDDAAAPAPATSAAASVPPVAALTADVVEPPATAALPPPDRVRIATIGVDSPLENLDVDGAGALKGPDDFGKAGWFANGTAPGDLGPAVIAGHVDSERGPAVFYRLRDLKPGDVVEVARGAQWIAFRVVAIERYPKTQFPTDKVYRPTPVPELRLITCGGAFDRDRRSYYDNIVVYAVRAE